MLVSSAGLLAVSLKHVLDMPTGFQPSGVLTGRITLPLKDYKDTPAQLAFVEANAEFGEIGGEGFNVTVIIAGVFAQIVAGKLSRAPRFVKGMAEQIVFGDAGIELLEKFLNFHDCVSVGEHTKYTSAGRM